MYDISNICNVYIHLYIYIIYIYRYVIQGFKETFFITSVTFRILRIFNGLLQIKSVKKYILAE